MSKDYAKKKNSHRRKKAAKKNNRVVKFALSFLFVGILMTYFYLDSARLVALKNNLLYHAPAKVAQLEPHEHPEAHNKNEQVAKPRFEFYTLLAGKQVDDKLEHSVPHSASHEEKKVAVVNMTKSVAETATAKRRYLLQVASLRNYNDADKLKAELLMEGFEVHVRSYKHNGITWYRVQVGPYLSHKHAMLAQTKLRREHFDSILKRTA